MVYKTKHFLLELIQTGPSLLIKGEIQYEKNFKVTFFLVFLLIVGSHTMSGLLVEIMLLMEKVCLLETLL